MTPSVPADHGGAPHRDAVPLLLAVDGGNSKTDVVVVDRAGRLIGQARGASSCHQMVGLPAAITTLETTIHAAFAAGGFDARVRHPRVALGVYCLAGLDLPVDARRLGAAIGAKGFTGRLVLHNDAMAVLRAGAPDGWGVALVCGAGINCVGVGPEGGTVNFPALGELSGDFTTGGSWLGTRALGLALRAGDGRGEATVLREQVPAHFGLETPEALLEAVHTGQLPYERLASLAPLLFDAAARDEPAAAAAVDLVADELAHLARAAIVRLGLGETAVPVVLGGGVFATPYRRFHLRLRRAVQEAAPGATFHLLSAPPVLGAALLGADALALGLAARSTLRRVLGSPAAGAAPPNAEH